MNERIKQLAEQAGIYKLDLSDETEYWIIEKFAELIVRDCMNAAQRISELRGATEEHIYGADTACVLISKLYGVKL